MNERIKEMAKLAQMRAEWMTPQGLEWFDNFKEQFAELIVRECLGMIENEASTYAEPVWAHELVNDIAERFGVKLYDKS